MKESEYGMGQIILQDGIMEKLTILSDSAKYDVACTSSGVERKGDGKSLGNAVGCGLCHTFTGDGRCISLLKILLTNECIYNCRYCVNRSSNDVKRAMFTPEEICTLTIEFYRRNYIEGLFLSSGIFQSPDTTMQLLYETIFLLRTKYHFNGYIHVKGIPGASAHMVEMVGYLADRMSVNLELPTAEGLRELAPNKVRKNILTPMRQIQNGIKESRMNHGITSMKSRVCIDEKQYYEQVAEIADSHAKLLDYKKNQQAILAKDQKKKAEAVAEESWQFEHSSQNLPKEGSQISAIQPISEGGSIVSNLPKEGSQLLSDRLASLERGIVRRNKNHYFVPAGQSTQMIIGATGETDFQIMSVTEALYQKFEMKRVFYSGFVNVNQDESLPLLGQKPPLLREHRLYQADFLLRFYGFGADELLSEKNPNFHEQIDPKCFWAVKHLEFFPVEINQADYYTLLRVPGIGTTSAKRIMTARKHGMLDFSDIKKMGVVLKRAQYFVTCRGRMLYGTPIEEQFITRHLIYNEPKGQLLLPDGSQGNWQQMSLFDTTAPYHLAANS